MSVGSFPADVLRRAFQGGIAFYDQLTAYNDPLETEFWQPARSDARGVVRYDPARAQNGLTLYTSGHDQRAFLIDMDGRVVHEWALAYSQIWAESAAVDKPPPAPFIYIPKEPDFPTGDLLPHYNPIS